MRETFANKLRELLGIPRQRNRVRVKYRDLKEREINAAFASLEPTHPAWLAFHQLIETARENALENADQNMDPPTILAGYVGGAAHLKMLRDDLNIRREAGLAQLEQKGTVKQEWLDRQTEPPPV